MKILIVKMSSLGDVVHAIPLAKVLKNGISGCTIDWVVNEEYAELLKGNPHIDEVIPFKRKEWLTLTGFFKNIKEVKNFAMYLKKKHYDLVIDVQGLFKSALVVLMAAGKRDMGHSNAREFSPVFYHEKVYGDPGLHAVERYLLFADKLGIKWQREELEFFIPFEKEDIAIVDSLLQKASLTEKNFAVFCPFSRWETKMWDERNFHALGKMLNNKGIGVVWTGEKGERLNREAKNNFIGKLSIKQLYCLMKKSKFVVTCDSGAMHIAGAADANIFALFGPTSPEKTGPYTIKGRAVVIKKDGVSCAPCFGRECDKQNACLEIKPEEVLQKIEETITL
jgi:heptosyltransferase-1